MLELAHPWLLSALPAPLLLWWLLPPIRNQVTALRVPFFRQLLHAAGIEPRQGAAVQRRSFGQVLWMALIWLILVGGLTRPEWVGEPVVQHAASRDVLLAVDLSGSMDYADFTDQQNTKIRRIEAVQRVLDRFIAERKKDRIGIVVFGTRAYLQLPFTRDIDTARALVRLMDVSMAGPKTALGDAIGLGIRAFDDSRVKQRLMILLSDGNDTASSMTPLNAAAIAAGAGIEIHTIAVGDPNASGEDRVDFETLEAIAERTHGGFYRAGDERALAGIYRRIDEMTAVEGVSRSWRPRQSLVHWPVIAALLLTLLGCGVALLKSWLAESADAESAP